MKKIINGKRYDTATAQDIKGYTNGKLYGDYTYWGETLYRKRTGEFFLYTEGGAATECATPAEGGGWVAGDRFTPLSEYEAKQWCEAHLDGDEYEAVFGTVEE